MALLLTIIWNCRRQNAVARTMNMQLRHQHSPITPLVDTRSDPIPGFPGTHAVIRRCEVSTIDILLSQLGLQSGGSKAEKEKRLFAYIGLSQIPRV